MHRAGASFALISIVLAISVLLITSACFAQISTRQSAQPRSQQTRVMQQSDHQRRLEQAKKNEIAEKQVASVAGIEDGSRSLDYVVLIILGASVVALVVISRRRRRTRKTYRW